jgi:hypothetical protein
MPVMMKPDLWGMVFKGDPCRRLFLGHLMKRTLHNAVLVFG